jgi:hypothetical protein
MKPVDRILWVLHAARGSLGLALICGAAVAVKESDLRAFVVDAGIDAVVPQ